MLCNLSKAINREFVLRGCSQNSELFVLNLVLDGKRMKMYLSFERACGEDTRKNIIFSLHLPRQTTLTSEIRSENKFGTNQIIYASPTPTNISQPPYASILLHHPLNAAPIIAVIYR